MIDLAHMQDIFGPSDRRLASANTFQREDVHFDFIESKLSGLSEFSCKPPQPGDFVDEIHERMVRKSHHCVPDDLCTRPYRGPEDTHVLTWRKIDPDIDVVRASVNSL